MRFRVLLACTATAACAVSGAAGCGPAGLPHGEASPEELGRAVLVALEREDARGLRALAVNEREFRDLIWPELPAARPERNLPAEYVWNDLRAKSDAGLRRILATRGGRRMRLVRLAFTAGSTQYDTYLVHRRTLITLRDGDGREESIRLFGSVVEHEGRFKIFSYATD